MDAFLEWLADKGLVQKCAAIRAKSDAERGVYSQRSVRENEIFLRINEALIITPERVRLLDNHLDVAVKRYPGLLTGFDVLCLFVVIEKLKGFGSKFYPYLDILPQVYSLPICQSIPSTSSHCFPPDIRSDYVKQLSEYEVCSNKIRAVFDWLLKVGHVTTIDENKKQSFEDNERLLNWAWATVNTRCIYVDTDDGYGNNISNDRLALMPFLDMINHSCEPKLNCKYNKISKTFDLVLINGTILEDEEIFICYGPHSNSKLFLEYGFILDTNPINCLTLPIESLKVYCSANSCADLTDEHWAILERAEIPCILYSTECEPSWAFLAVFKILSMSHNELNDWRKIVYNSVVEEFLANKVLVRLAVQCLKLHANVLKEDALKSLVELNALPNVLDYTKRCISQLWREEQEIVSQTMIQMTDL